MNRKIASSWFVITLIAMCTGCSKSPESAPVSKLVFHPPPNNPFPFESASPNPSPSDSYSYEIIPLKLYWNGRTDNLTTTAPLDQQDNVAGYQLVRTEGYVFTQSQPGTVPLKQYWSAQRGDYQLTINAQSEKDALSDGYRFIRIEGYTYPSWQPGLVPLNLYYNPDRPDNFVAASAQAGLYATNNGYHFVRTEGYIISNDH